MDEILRKRIQDDIVNNKIMLYMKGTPDEPQCGFSAQAVSVLRGYNVPFKAFNVLGDEEVRGGIKEYSDWPTIPQLYVNGKFIGGCDIITELHENGELGEVLGK
jgi:monothiol glutaredoxin